MNKRKRRKAKGQLNVTFHQEKDFTGLSSNKIMSPTQVPRSPWLTASCTFIRQCDTKPQDLLSDRVSSRKLAILIPLFMSSTEKKSWSDGTLQQCHLHPLIAGWTLDISCLVLWLHCALLEQRAPAYCITHSHSWLLQVVYYMFLMYHALHCYEWLAFSVLLASRGSWICGAENPSGMIGGFLG